MFWVGAGRCHLLQSLVMSTDTEALYQGLEVFCVNLEKDVLRQFVTSLCHTIWEDNWKEKVEIILLKNSSSFSAGRWFKHPSQGVPFHRGGLSSSTEGAGSQSSGWVCRWWGQWPVLLSYQKWVSLGVGDKYWWLCKSTTLAFWLEMHSAF